VPSKGWCIALAVCIVVVIEESVWAETIRSEVYQLNVLDSRVARSDRVAVNSSVWVRVSNASPFVDEVFFANVPSLEQGVSGVVLLSLSCPIARRAHY